MPIYEYECPACRYYAEVMQKVSEKPLKKCPSCGKGGFKKLISAPVFRLKGSGWYETDFKSDKDGQRNLVSAEKDEAAKQDSKPDAKTDAKPDAKTDAKTDAKADAKVDGKSDAKAAKGEGGATAKTGEKLSAKDSKPAAGNGGASGKRPTRRTIRSTPKRASKTKARGKRR